MGQMGGQDKKTGGPDADSAEGPPSTMAAAAQTYGPSDFSRQASFREK